MHPLQRPVSILVRTVESRRGSGAEFIDTDMNCCSREVGDTARVVQIEVGQHDVLDIRWVETKTSDLCGRGFAGVEKWDRLLEKLLAQAHSGSRNVVRADSGVHQDEPLRLGLDQDAVCDRTLRRKPRRRLVGRDQPHAAAVEVMNAHIDTYSLNVTSRRAASCRSSSARSPCTADHGGRGLHRPVRGP